MDDASASAAPLRRRRRRRRARLSPLTVIGELLLLSGIAVLGYLVWQPWHTGFVVAGEQTRLSSEDSARWAEENRELQSDGIPVAPREPMLETSGILHVPAFGTTFQNRIVEGTDFYTVLEDPTRGVGHYESTQMPGEPGNFAIAAHRSGPDITPFREVMNLRVGDPIFIETPVGWYVYRFRDVEYVLPTQSDVVNPFPRLEGEPGEDMILTLTTCHPKWAGSDERAIAYAVFEGYQPLQDGPPAELLELNPELQNGAAS